MIDRAKALNDKRPLTLFAVRLRWQTNSILCKNPMNLVSVSEQEYYKKILAAGCALAEIKKEICGCWYLCKNPMNLVSVSEQEYYKKLLAAGCALAEIKKEICGCW